MMAKKKPEKPVVHYGLIKLPYKDKWYFIACDQTLARRSYQNATKNKSKVTCPNCRRTKIFRDKQ